MKVMMAHRPSSDILYLYLMALTTVSPHIGICINRIE